MLILRIAAIIFASSVIATAANAAGCTVTQGQYAGRSGTYNQDTDPMGNAVGTPDCVLSGGPSGTKIYVDCSGNRCKAAAKTVGISGVKPAPTETKQAPRN
jgi:hypothetical protein